jgi:hypothetical protein
MFTQTTQGRREVRDKGNQPPPLRASPRNRKSSTPSGPCAPCPRCGPGLKTDEDNDRRNNVDKIQGVRNDKHNKLTHISVESTGGS